MKQKEILAVNVDAAVRMESLYRHLNKFFDCLHLFIFDGVYN